ncbi:hypothetical protein CRYUN_Cryun06bG0054900 [Craigia yunnanensis]
MLSAIEVRALRDSKLQHSNARTFKGLFLHAAKVSGPSPGVGHKYNNLQTIEVEKSGPSPGVGHKYKNLKNIEVEKSGPSPGEGHKISGPQVPRSPGPAAATTSCGPGYDLSPKLIWDKISVWGNILDVAHG